MNIVQIKKRLHKFLVWQYERTEIWINKGKNRTVIPIFIPTIQLFCIHMCMYNMFEDSKILASIVPEKTVMQICLVKTGKMDQYNKS